MTAPAPGQPESGLDCPAGDSAGKRGAGARQEDSVTPTDIFGEIDAALKADPERAAGMNAVYQFDLSGDDGGKFHIVVGQGDGEAGEGAVEDPNITISMAASDFVAMRTGRLDPTMAFMSGKIKISGDMGLAMKLQSVLRQ